MMWRINRYLTSDFIAKPLSILLRIPIQNFLIEPNPREVKRFLNNFIVAYEIHGSDEKCDPTVLLILQALSVRWDNFYRVIMDSTQGFREIIKRFSELTERDRSIVYDDSQQQNLEERLRFDEESKRLLNTLKQENELWQFVKENSKAIFETNDLGIYRRAGEAVKEDFLKQAKYDSRDYAIIANNVFLQLCSLEEGWHDIRGLAENLGAYSDKDEVRYIAETVLVNMQYIERDPLSHGVKLTSLGRGNCRKGIEIPPSDIQRLRQEILKKSGRWI
jgi:hypothetical protein